MGVEYTRAEAVSVGEKVTSRQLISLARAVNSRLRCGPGDPAYRVFVGFANAWRQVRNPDEAGNLFPAQLEAFDLYHHFEPWTAIEWPVAGPGEPEGANVANPFMRYVFGAEIDDNPDEPVRLENNNTFWTDSDGTLTGAWELGKYQRGAVDPFSGDEHWPAGESAQSIFGFQFFTGGIHGTTYGGFFPTPTELLPDCGDSDTADIGYLIPSLEVKFTSTREDVDTTGLHGTVTTNGDGNKVVTYAGSCPCGSAFHASGHVQYVATYALMYHVYVSNSTTPDCGYDIDRLPRADWIQGPYDGEGRLSRQEGLQIQRLGVWPFIRDFRGTDGQRTPDSFNIQAIGTDFQKVMTRQWPLAPNRGQSDGTNIEALYPTVTFAGAATLAGGTLGNFGSGQGTKHLFASGYVLGGIYARASGLVGRAQVDVLADGELAGRLTLDADDAGNADALLWLTSKVTPEYIEIRLRDTTRFTTASGYIRAETTEQYDYRANYWDAFLLCRLSATTGGEVPAGSVAGGGRDCDFAKEITGNLFRYGAIVNKFGAAGASTQDNSVTQNPVYDAARRYTRDCVRMFRRQALDSYEVSDSVSHIYVRRWAYGMVNSEADLLRGIAPDYGAVASGDLLEDETYVVHSAGGSGRITYKGADYDHGQTFTADTTTDFQSVGDGQLFVYDGIRHEARKKGMTNEWVLWVESCPYHPSESSLWKPAAYADYFPLIERCHIWSPDGPNWLQRHMAYNHNITLDTEENAFKPIQNATSVQAEWTAPEGPSGYRYVGGANTGAETDDFCSSCQIYVAPAEIDSAVVVSGRGTVDEVVRLTLKTRLKAHPDAPSSVARSPGSWSTTERNNLAAEDYRTPDNALREYVLHQTDPARQCSWKVGDGAAGNSLSLQPDNPMGACYPRIYCVKLIPEPYEDGNTAVNGHDARCVIDECEMVESYLKFMCEGFVDERTTLEKICVSESGDIFDYTFENLMYDADTAAHVSPMAESARDDDPPGFGPLPNTLMYARVFNRLCNAVNLLDKARLDIPLRYESNYHDRQWLSDEVTPVGASCSLVGTHGAYLDSISSGRRESVLISTDSGWGENGLTAQNSFGFYGSSCPYKIHTIDSYLEFRIQTDPAFAYAIPTELQTLLDEYGSGTVAKVHHTTTYERRREVATDLESTFYGACFPYFIGGVWHTWDQTQTTTTYCQMVTSGEIRAGSAPTTDLNVAHCGADPSMVGNAGDYTVSMDILSLQHGFFKVPIVDL